jgi:hypothetical protein
MSILRRLFIRRSKEYRALSLASDFIVYYLTRAENFTIDFQSDMSGINLESTDLGPPQPHEMRINIIINPRRAKP